MGVLDNREDHEPIVIFEQDMGGCPKGDECYRAIDCERIINKTCGWRRVYSPLFEWDESFNGPNLNIIHCTHFVPNIGEKYMKCFICGKEGAKKRYSRTGQRYKEPLCDYCTQNMIVKGYPITLTFENEITRSAGPK